MAINKWAIVTLDASAASKPDRVDHRNTTGLSGADGGNVTVAIDTAVITRLTQLDSAYASARAILSGSLSP
jgi:hypothetical protein